MAATIIIAWWLLVTLSVQGELVDDKKNLQTPPITNQMLGNYIFIMESKLLKLKENCLTTRKLDSVKQNLSNALSNSEQKMMKLVDQSQSQQTRHKISLEANKYNNILSNYAEEVISFLRGNIQKFNDLLKKNRNDINKAKAEIVVISTKTAVVFAQPVTIFREISGKPSRGSRQ